MSEIPPEEFSADAVASAAHMPDMNDLDARLLLTAIFSTDDAEWLAA